MTTAARSTLGAAFVGALLLLAYVLLHAERGGSPAWDAPPRPHGTQEAPSQPLTGSPAPALEPGPQRATVAPSPSKTFHLDITVVDANDDPIDAIVHAEYGAEAVRALAPSGRCALQVTKGSRGRLIVRAQAMSGNLWGIAGPAWPSSPTAQPIAWTLRLAGPRFTGRVLDSETGTPISGAELRPLGWFTEVTRWFMRPTASGDDGVFDICLDLARYDEPLSDFLRVLHPDFVPAEVPLPTSHEPVEVRLLRRQRLRGRVQLEHGRPAPELSFKVRLRSTQGAIREAGYVNTLETVRRAYEPLLPDDPRWAEMISVSKTTVTTDADGGFDLPLDFPGLAEGYIVLPGYCATRFAIDTGADRSPLEVVLRPSGAPRARARLLSASGKPRGDEELRISEGGGWPGLLILTVKTDADGWFDTSALAEGAAVAIEHFKFPQAQALSSGLLSRISFDWTVRHFETITVPD